MSLENCVADVHVYVTKHPERQYLFRGESRHWDHTYSFLYRLLRQQNMFTKDQENVLLDDLLNVSLLCNVVLGNTPVFANPAAAIAAMAGRHVFQDEEPRVTAIRVIGSYLQHYELPTPLLDLTDDLPTAVTFAAGEVDPSEASEDSHPGRFF